MAAVAAVVAAIVLLWPCEIKPEQVRPTVVYVRAAYHYEVTIEDNPLVGEAKELLVKTTSAQPYQATAFFIDEEGRMATNRHVALPWDEAYREEGETEALREAYKTWLLKQFEGMQKMMKQLGGPGGSKKMKKLQRMGGMPGGMGGSMPGGNQGGMPGGMSGSMPGGMPGGRG